MSLNLQINSTYTFNTLAPALLGAVIKNAVLNAVLDFETATKFENVAVLYEQIYPALPSGSPQSPTGVLFYRFTSESGQKIFIAEPWIDGSSLVVVTNQNFTINIVNATSTDRTNIQTALAHLGVNFTFVD